MTESDTPLRIVIVDDEEPARMAVRQAIEAIGDLEIAAECANGFDAVQRVAELKPDVVLLDVQMPKLDGFEVLELIGRDVPVIFITAYDEFALRAFEVHAVDYLLKPFTSDRLAEALSRVQQRSEQGGPDPGALARTARPPGSPLERVVV